VRRVGPGQGAQKAGSTWLVLVRLRPRRAVRPRRALVDRLPWTFVLSVLRCLGRLGLRALLVQ
jgi:hypothetical protein